MIGFSLRRSICTERTSFPSCSCRKDTRGARSKAQTSRENSKGESTCM